MLKQSEMSECSPPDQLSVVKPLRRLIVTGATLNAEMSRHRMPIARLAGTEADNERTRESMAALYALEVY